MYQPENLLCANDEVDSLSITDFGIAKLLLPGQKIRGSCGSPSYVSPEILLKQEYSHEVDMWAVGVISYILSVNMIMSSVSTNVGLELLVTSHLMKKLAVCRYTCR